MSRRLAGILPVLGLLAVGSWLEAGRGRIAVVAAGDSVQAALGEASVVYLQPGEHDAFVVAMPGRTVVGSPGARVAGTVEVRADRARLLGLHVTGGREGIVVRRAEGVLLGGVTVHGAELHGIEVVDASTRIVGCRIGGLSSPYAQGIEVRNASTRPRSVVEGCSVTGGQEGLMTHSSRVEFLGNRVTGTTLRAIGVSEMSEGLVARNVVRGVTGAGLYCGDMSHCEIVGNDVAGVRPNPAAGKSAAGYPAVGWYYSTLRLRDNALSGGAPEPVRLALGSVQTDRFPLSVWPAGWRGALPGIGVSALALGLLGAAAAGARMWLRRHRGRPSTRVLTRGAAVALAGGFVAQSFHMLEHVVQVWQVYVADAEHRSGLAGRVVDTEWVHFAYNAVVVAFMVWTWSVIRSEPLRSRLAGVRHFLLGALAIQAYHVVEHTAKLAQHVATGVDPAPGILGRTFGLVWFHFGLNLAVYAGIAVVAAPALALGWRLWKTRSPAPLAAPPAARRETVGA